MPVLFTKAQRNIFIILLLLNSEIAFSQNYWPQVSSPTTRELYKCFFTDILNGWIVGDTETILHTSNGGLSWGFQDVSTQCSIHDVVFVNNRLGWAAANDYIYIKTYILKTTNGGTNWNSSIFPDSNKVFQTIYFIDSLNGFVGGFNSEMYKTTDGGVSWIKPSIDTGFFQLYAISKFAFRTVSTGLACGGINDFGGMICKTTNMGLNWNCAVISPVWLRDIVYLDANRINVVGGEYDLFTAFAKTSDSGNNWNIDTTFRFFGVGVSLAYRTRAELWIPAASSWYVNYDSAKEGKWIEMPIPYPYRYINWALFIDSLHGWAVGNTGSIYKFDTSLIGINQLSRNAPAEFHLYQNYPNPFNPVTKIKFNMPSNVKRETANVKLIIYDVLGREITSLVNEQLKPGVYEVKWDGSNYASGIYFYFLKAGSYSDSKKMVLVK